MLYHVKQYCQLFAHKIKFQTFNTDRGVQIRHPYQDCHIAIELQGQQDIKIISSGLT